MEKLEVIGKITDMDIEFAGDETPKEKAPVEEKAADVMDPVGDNEAEATGFVEEDAVEPAEVEAPEVTEPAEVEAPEVTEPAEIEATEATEPAEAKTADAPIVIGGDSTAESEKAEEEDSVTVEATAESAKPVMVEEAVKPTTSTSRPKMNTPTGTTLKPLDAAAESESLPSRKASFRRKMTELKQVDLQETFENIKETSVATAKTIEETTKKVSETKTGKQVVRQTRRAEHYLKSRQGKRLIAVVVVLVLALAGWGKWRSGADLREGLKLCENGYYVDAQAPLQQAVLKLNKNPKAYDALGMAYLGSGEYEDAIKQFQLAQNLDEEDQGAWRGLGIAYYYTGEYEQGVEALNKALEYCGINVNNLEYDIMWYRGACEVGMKDYEAAVYTYGALMELEGDSALLHYYRGDAYCRMNDKISAMADFDAAVAMPGNGYELFFDIYNSMEAVGWRTEAVAYLDQALAGEVIDASAVPSEAIQSKYQGMIYYLKGSYKKALKLLNTKDLEEDFESQSYSGLCYEALKKPEKAQTIYRTLVNTYTDNAAAYNCMAMYLLRQGKYKKAVSYLQQGIENCPAATQEVLYYNLVTVYESMGDYASAKDALRQYGVIYGQSKTAHEKSFIKERKRT